MLLHVFMFIDVFSPAKLCCCQARLGVGAKVQDLTEYCTRDPDVKVTVSKKGDLVVLHGPNKAE